MGWPLMCCPKCVQALSTAGSGCSTPTIAAFHPRILPQAEGCAEPSGEDEGVDAEIDARPPA